MKVLRKAKKRVNRTIAFWENRIPGTLFQLEKRNESVWMIHGRSELVPTSTVELRLGNRLLAKTFVQQIGKRKYFRFILEKSILTSLVDQEGIFVKAGKRQWRVRKSRSFRAYLKEQNRKSAENYTQQLDQGWILGSEGRFMPPKNADTDWVEKTLSHYDNANRTFQSMFGYQLFIVGGTLLGWARDRDIISFDKDLDTAYVSNAKTPDALRSEYRDIIIALLRAGHDISIVTKAETVRRYYAWWRLDDDIRIDIFPGAFVNGRYCRPTFVETELNQEDMFPLLEERLRGVPVLVPRQYERKLAAVYGKTWRTPDPFWAKTKSRRMSQYLDLMALNSDDLEAIAAVSSKEGDLIRSWLQENKLPNEATS